MECSHRIRELRQDRTKARRSNNNLTAEIQSALGLASCSSDVCGAVTFVIVLTKTVIHLQQISIFDPIKIPLLVTRRRRWISFPIAARTRSADGSRWE
jgi:hypothetical protein